VTQAIDASFLDAQGKSRLHKRLGMEPRSSAAKV